MRAATTTPSEANAERAADAAADHGRWLSRTHFSSLDGLRCMSILPVIWHHSTPHPLEGVWGRGPLGVDLFFAISGFLITTLLLRERRSTGTVSIRDFYVRRSLRIFPLYYGVLAAYVVRALVFMHDSPQRTHFLHSLPWYASYTANWFVDFTVPHPVVFAFAWSLATEEQFYLVWPTVVKAGRRWWVPVSFMVAMLVVDQLTERGMLLAVVPWESLGTRMLTSIATPICLGALLAYGLDGARTYRALGVVLGRKWSAPVALGVLIWLVTWNDLPVTAVHVAMVALVGAVSIRADHGLRALVDWSPARYVGTISYGAYLLHVSVITAVKSVLPAGLQPSWVIFVLATALTVGMAAVVHKGFEVRFLRLRERFRPRRAGTRDAPYSPFRARTDTV